MSPEQAKGRTVDKRSDVWAFGAVLYEMLTGTRAFEAEDVSETLAAVLRAEIDWTLLPEDLPPVLGTYIRRCLQKDPKQRIRDIGDVSLALEGAFETGASQAAASVSAPANAMTPSVSHGAVAVDGVGRRDCCDDRCGHPWHVGRGSEHERCAAGVTRSHSA